jgi:hypothetical protein
MRYFYVSSSGWPAFPPGWLQRAGVGCMFSIKCPLTHHSQGKITSKSKRASHSPHERLHRGQIWRPGSQLNICPGVKYNKKQSAVIRSGAAFCLPSITAVTKSLFYSQKQVILSCQFPALVLAQFLQ